MCGPKDERDEAMLDLDDRALLDEERNPDDEDAPDVVYDEDESVYFDELDWTRNP